MSLRQPTKYAQYLGDGAYADYDGYHIILWAERGESSRTAVIYLDPGVQAALIRYEAWLKARIAAEHSVQPSTQEE